MRLFPIIVLMLATIGSPCVATTIATDGFSMAADTQGTRGYTKLFHHKKLERIDGFVVGCAGNVVDIKKFKAWFKNRSQGKPKLKSMSALVMDKNCVWLYDESCIPEAVFPPYAIGTGSRPALGAMKAGANAERAVRISTEIDLFTGGDVDVMKPED